MCPGASQFYMKRENRKSRLLVRGPVRRGRGGQRKKIFSKTVLLTLFTPKRSRREKSASYIFSKILSTSTFPMK